jgi:hypothetical protein
VNLSKTKWLVLFIAIGFAILQALQPFVHAHIGPLHPLQNTGFHVGEEHEELTFSSEFSVDHGALDIPHASHTISVESGINEVPSLSLAAEAIYLVFFCLLFSFVLPLETKIVYSLVIRPFQSLKKRLPAPRAPPKY